MGGLFHMPRWINTSAGIVALAFLPQFVLLSSGWTAPTKQSTESVVQVSGGASQSILNPGLLNELPATVRAWLRYEQELLSREVNTRYLMELTNQQNADFTPEAGNVFSITGYWLTEDVIRSVENPGVATDLVSGFVRQHKGKREFLFLVHPESYDLYADLVAKASGTETFYATATASSRTLLAWRPGLGDKAFFAKLSLNKVIGGVIRTIHQGEIARSIGTDLVLNRLKDRLPSSFLFIDETLGLVPNEFRRGGMLLRPIPEGILLGERAVVPLFALYGGDGGTPLLAQMIKKSGESPEDFVRNRIILPFVEQWAKLALDFGIVMEPHAQNVLLEIGSNGLPTGRFVHRDFGGFNFDLDYMEAKGLLKKADLPNFEGVEKEYKKKLTGEYPRKSLITYFGAGFLYNLDTKVPQWQASGLIGGPRIQGKKTFSALLAKELARILTERRGSKVKLEPNLRNLDSVVKEERGRLLIPARCEGLFR